MHTRFFQNKKVAGRTSIILGTVVGFHRGGLERTNRRRRERIRGFGAGACHGDGIAWLGRRTFFAKQRLRARMEVCGSDSWRF